VERERDLVGWALAAAQLLLAGGERRGPAPGASAGGERRGPASGASAGSERRERALGARCGGRQRRALGPAAAALHPSSREARGRG